MFMHRTSLKSRRNRKDSIDSTKKRGRRVPKAAAAYSAWYACEQLETRRMLVTWVGGGVLNGQPQETVHTFLDANLKPVRVALWGTITAEFIFVGVDGGNNAVVENPVQIPPADATTPHYGSDLFEIYIASASPTASISIAEFSTTANSGFPMEPYTGSNTITVEPGQGGNTITETVGPGDVYIGGRDFTPAEESSGTLPVDPIADGIPFSELTDQFSQIGVRPPSADGSLYAGIVSAPGVSLNRIFIGGTVTGRVDLGGSINTFYAGQILTGDASGVLTGDEPSTSDGTSTSALDHNFNVAGDIDNLISNGPIGTSAVVLTGEPDYETGFRMSVEGHIGEVYSPNSIDGSIYAVNSPTLKGLGVPQQAEFITGPTPAARSGETFFEGNAPNSDGLEGVPSLADDNAIFRNSTPDKAQLLATPFSSAEGHNAVQLEGELDDSTTVGHDVAWYGIALGAEQTIKVTLNLGEADAADLQLGIFAPEEAIAASATNLLASTYNADDIDATANQPITFTSTDAGIYYFAIAYDTDTTFSGGKAAQITGAFGPVDYELDVTGVKNIGIGGIATPGSIDLRSAASETGSADFSVRVDYGDLGAIVSTGGGTLLWGDADGDPDPITATTGSIRVLQAADIGTLVMGAYGYGPDLDVAGNVGVIRTTDTGGELVLNQDITAVNTGEPIGGDYQLIDCAGTLNASLVADGDIGTIRAAEVGNVTSPLVWQVDANDKSGDGTIDLIDVTGTNFGTLATGGPEITTGPGGNVRYIHIAPTCTVYNDQFFGGGIDDPILYNPGKAANLVDDSGTPFTITPYAGESDVSGDAAAAPTTTTGTTGTTGTTTTTTTSDETSDILGGQLSILTYGIEGSGGVAVISATETAGDIDVSTSSSSSSTTGTSTTTTTTSAYAGPVTFTVTTHSNGKNGSVEFGQINLIGGGTDLTFDDTTRAFTTAAGGSNAVAEPMNATFSGKSLVDVYNLTATTPLLADDGSAFGAVVSTGSLTGVGSVVNNTAGEIVGFQAQDVQTLEAASLGEAKSHVYAPVEGATVYVNEYPFSEQRNLIQIGGTLITDGSTGDPTAGTIGYAETIESSGSLGNILTNGTIENILPDVGAAAPKGTQEGIVGVIYAAAVGEFSTTPASSPESGNILNINIGDGLGYSGSGGYAIDGIFADNYIGTITNQHGSDIRGDIDSDGAAGGLPAAETISPITGEPIVSKSPQGAYIGAIDLSGGGSIINAKIYTTETIDQAADVTAFTGNGFTITDPNGEETSGSNAQLYAIGAISLSGDGGIIGSILDTGGIDTISVAGFGIVSSDFETLNDDVIGSVNTAGYGIRSSFFVGPNSIGSVTASGNGKELADTHYSQAVRQSESGATTDAYSGLPLNIYDDLDEYLGTSAKKSTRKGQTEAGVIADSTFTGSYQLGSVAAWEIIGNTGSATTSITLSQAPSGVISATPASAFDFANSIGTVAVTENTTNTTFTTGTLDKFSSGDDVIGSKFTIAGQLKSFIAGFINGSTHINATGPDGVITYLAATSGLNANINASVGIGEILVDGNLDSLNIDSGGNLDELYIKGNVESKTSVVVAKTIASLTVKHNLLGGSTIQAGKITKRSIGGVSNGNIIITGV